MWDLVGELYDPASGPAPIVLLWGSRGGAVHDALRTVVDDRPMHRPHVFATSLAPRRPLDEDMVELPPDFRPHKVALALASRLGAPTPGFGRLRFPRLLLGALVVVDPPGILNVARTRKEVLDYRLAGRRRVLDWLAASADGFVATLGLPQAAEKLLGLGVHGLTAFLSTAPVIRGRALAWYGTDGVDPVERLVQHAIQASSSHPDAEDHVDELLCRAFLADLRAEYATASVWRRTLGRSLVVLEGADEEPLVRFLAMLGRLHGDDVPVVVVGGAEKRGPLDLSYDGHPEAWPTRDVARARRADWAAGATSGHQGWRAFYPVEITRPHPPAITGSRGDAVEGLVARLAQGHLLGETVVRPVAEAMAPRALRGVLERPAPEHVPGISTPARSDDDVPASPTVADVIIRQVVGDEVPEMLPGLLRVAAAPDLGEMHVDRALDGQTGAGPGKLVRFLDLDMWVVRPEHPGDGPSRLHPLGRRALLHHLAHPTAANAPRWFKVHSDLRTLAFQHGDTVSMLYHDLALGRVDQVATALTWMLDGADIDAWFGRLLLITSAPLERPEAAVTATAGCEARAALDFAPDSLVSRMLIASLQAHQDPLGDPTHETCIEIHRRLNDLSDVRGARVYLAHRAQEYLACWNSWH